MPKNEEVYDEPSTVTPKDGKVVVDGPDHVDVTITPEAAVETGERLIDGAAHAAGQRRLREERSDLGANSGALSIRRH